MKKNWRSLLGVVGIIGTAILLMGIGGRPRNQTFNLIHSCTTTASQLPEQGAASVCIQNPSTSGGIVFLGATSAVTTGTGFEIAVGGTWCDDVRNVSQYYCIVAAGSEQVNILGSN